MSKTPVQIGDLRDALSSGTQPYVDQSSLISVPFTTIVNRAQIPNIASDLRPSFGVERIMVQSVYQIQNEFGPNGEPVWGALNDTNGLLRYVGNWINLTDNNGFRPYANTQATTDYVEITFYGTGLNILHYIDTPTRTVNVSVDGGSPTTLTFQGSTILNARNYATNPVSNAVTGLALGLHTVKLSPVSNPQFVIYGFEILNTNSISLLNVNPGVSYVSGQKISASVVQTSTYNSSFTNISGTPGTKGGHVLVYLDSTGALKKDIQYTDVTQNNLSAATHTNEEIVRTYFFREFGAGRSDDFSLVAGTVGNKAFTLDDGTTSLNGSNVGAFADPAGYEGVFLNAANSFITFTFVGTGLDITQTRTTALDGTVTISVDGVAITTGTATGTVFGISNKVTKIVSGLPYGTHTVKILMATFGSVAPAFGKFIVYQPKKPTLPSGAIELADYNLMATYVASTVVGQTASGVLRKYGLRETVYTGTWNAVSADNTFLQGFNINSTSAGATYKIVFYGTGFELKHYENTAGNYTISVDGSSNLSGFTTSFVFSGTGLTFTPAAGVVAGTPSVTSTAGCTVQVSNMTLGLHTVIVTLNSGQFYNDAFDIITPIHSAKSTLYGDYQNSLPIGSCALSDNRQLTPIKSSLSTTKAWAQAVGVTSVPTTTSTAFVPLPDMSVAIQVSKDTEIEVIATVDAYTNNAAGNAGLGLALFIDGIQQSPVVSSTSAGNGIALTSALCRLVRVSRGTHKVDLYWSIGNGQTLTADGTRRVLTVKER